MAVLPYFDHIKDDTSHSQYIWLVLFTYFTTLLFALLFVFAIHNYYRYLLRTKRGRNCERFLSPLAVFYELAIITILLRTFSILFWVWVTEQEGILIVTMPPLFKLNVGLVQAWIIIELIVRV